MKMNGGMRGEPGPFQSRNSRQTFWSQTKDVNIITDCVRGEGPEEWESE